MSENDVVERKSRTDSAVLFKRILVPTDLSSIADAALDFAIELARRTSATVEVLTVLGLMEGDAFSPVHYSPEASARHRSSLELLREALSDLIARHDTSDIRLASSVHKGQPLPTILKTAERIDADLLVVATHDRSRIQRLLAGSSAEELVRRASCSVLVVHEADRTSPSAIERILVPVDLSDVSKDLLQYAHLVAQSFGAQLDVVHVVEPFPLLDAFSGAMTIRDMVPDFKKQSAAAVEKLIAGADLGSEKRRVFVEEGHAAACIIDRASSEQSDLVVLGKQGRSAIERFFIGSVTERIVRHAPCPVLVVDGAASVLR